MTFESDLLHASQLSKFVEQIHEGMTLNESLNELVLFIEKNIKSPVDIFASILLLDETGQHLYRGAAPSLPDMYNKAIDGIKIGPNVGSCGTAVYSGHSIFVVDIENDALWADYKEFALAHGLRACWSVPIVGKSKGILGTFALYYGRVRNPSLRERQFIDDCANAAAKLIERSFEPEYKTA